MTNNHIDQLAEWWETADIGPVEKGDTVIKRHPDGRYTIREAEKGWENTNYRILARAPKPKPAWHDAVAVLGNHRDYAEERRTVWVQIDDGEHDRVNIEGDTAADHHLVNVTPLIEAKVTDEMVERAREEAHGCARPVPAWIMRAALTAALGLETK